MGHPVIEAIISASGGGRVLETYRDVAAELEKKLKPEVEPIPSDILAERAERTELASNIVSNLREFMSNFQEMQKMFIEQG